ncbi:MAG TPA: hypothetical protein VHD83_21780 [Puia sp.]|nr:hypothetical protein [Puia sp.]
MKVKLTPLSLLSFFCLVFLIHEIHDWAHFLTAASFCGCLGNRTFDFWSPCTLCNSSTGGLAMATLAGPLVNYLVLWGGWTMMHPDNPPEKQSVGYAMVFATLPFPGIMAALAGGGDVTWALRQLFQHPNGSNHYIVAGAGLLIVTALSAPPLIRAFVLVAGWVQRIIWFVLFLVLPGMVDHWLVGKELNKLMSGGFLSHQILRGGAQLFLFVWLAVVLVLYLLTGRSLRTMVEYKEATV